MLSLHTPEAPTPADECTVISDYAARLLADLGMENTIVSPDEEPHPAVLQAESGLMWLCGENDGDPDLLPVPLSSCANGVIRALQCLPGMALPTGFNGAGLLTERAAITGHHRRGMTAPGESCRLIATADGMIALNLARPSDWEDLPALFGSECADSWAAVSACATLHRTSELVDQGRLLGMALADAKGEAPTIASWFIRSTLGRPVGQRLRPPRVLDLSSLWAGPLCTHLWALAGADVLKLESVQRPDGARNGPPAFFALLNNGKTQLEMDLSSEQGIRQLEEHIRGCDIVVEGSRPRALQQLGISAEKLVSETPGLTWLSITGHGREPPQAEWIAFGDDAAVAAGLSSVIHEATGHWRICGDAIADPLSGMHMALVGWHSWVAGGGELISLSLAGTVRHCIACTRPADGDYRQRQHAWRQRLSGHRISLRPPPPQFRNPPARRP